VADWITSTGGSASAELLAAWARIEEHHHAAWREGRVPHDEHRRRRLREFLPLLGLPVGDDAALDRQFHDDYLRRYRERWRGFDDVETGLSAIAAAGLPVAWLTNGIGEQQRAKIEALGLTGRVGPVLTAGDLGMAKPRPEVFHAACARLGVAPEDTLHVGDDHPVDVVGARAAGMLAVHLDRTGQGPFDEPSRVTTLAEPFLSRGSA
jgi:putative hydrolase of the HAD superfamily